MYLKHSIRKILFTFGLTAVLITGFNMHKDVIHADVLEETTEESTQKEDEYSHGNNENNRQTTTESEETHTDSGFSYYWYNNKRPGQIIKDSNGNVKKYYQTRYEYLDLPEKDKNLSDDLSKNDLMQYTHYENSVFRKYQENEDVLYEDAFGNIVIQTYSTDRNSNSFYRTIGYTFSRVKNSGVLNLNSKKISKRKEVPANKKWLYDDNYNVDDATMKDWTKLYGSDPHYTEGGSRDTISIYLPTEVYSKSEKPYMEWRKKHDGIAATYIGPSANHQEKYKAAYIHPLAQAVYRIPGKKGGRRHSINTWVYASDDIFGPYSETKKEEGYLQSRLYRAKDEDGDRGWYNEVREALKYNAAWFGVDAIIEVYGNGKLKNTATYKNPGAANVYGDRSDQFNRYIRLGGRLGTSVETKIEREGMTLTKNKYKEGTSNIPTTSSFTPSDAIPNSSSDKYTSPKVHTYNTSNDFELGTAIPTTETYTNTINNDSWYGSIKITRYTKTIDVDIAWTCKFTVRYYTEEPDDEGEGTHQVEHHFDTSTSGSLSYNLSADCFAISDINLAQLSGAIASEIKDSNSNWKTMQYSGLNESEVPIHFIIPYKEKGETTYKPTCFSNDDPLEGNIPEVTADTVNNYYMVIPQEEYSQMLNSNNYQGTLGTFASYAEGNSAAKKWARSTADGFVNSFMQAWKSNITNDTLSVNGTDYLKGQYVAAKNADGWYVANPEGHGSSSINEEDYKFNGCYPGSDSGTATLSSHMIPGDHVNVPEWTDGTTKEANKSVPLVFKEEEIWELPSQTWSWSRGDEPIIGDLIRDNPNVITTSNVTIPKSCANGIYYTKLDSTYRVFGCVNKTPKKNTRHLIIDDGKLTDLQKQKYGGFWLAISKKLPETEKSGWTYTDDNGVNKVNDPQKNEGIHVHSPALSPISIKGEKQTQLINQDESVTYEGGAQLILDNTYDLTFDWDNYFKMKAKYVKGYDGNHDSNGNLIPSAGWSKYLEEKLIRFPYSVEIVGYTTMNNSTKNKEEHSVNKYFEPICGSDDKSSYDVENVSYGRDVTQTGEAYTPWLYFPGNTISIKIYIPAWANEGSYVPNNMYDSSNAYKLAQNERCIQLEVRANNYSTETSKPGQDKINKNYRHHSVTDTQGEGHNGTKDNGGTETYEYYGASYEYPTEVSGIIYGFQIDTINNPDVFTGETKDEETGLAETLANLVKNKTEKNVGMKNRIGGTVLRHTLDGSIVDTAIDTTQKKNTLPLTSGKSDVAKKNGFLQRGNTFSFEVKTIADLDQKDDKLSITPEFRYYTAQGKSKKIALYYDNPGGSGEYIYMPNETDSDYTETYLWDQYHRNCYYDYDKKLDSSKDNYDTTFWSGLYDYKDKYAGMSGIRNLARNALMNTSWKCSRLNNIELPAGLRLFTANEEELRDNLAQSVSEASRYTRKGDDDTQSVDNTGTYNITKSEYEDLSNSMQTWYGTYTIPSSLKVVDVEKIKKICEQAGHPYDSGKDPLQNYLDVKGSVTSDSDIFINDGYLVLNFDIKSYKDNGRYEHLQYYGTTDATLNMWNREDGDPDTPTKVDPGDGTPSTTIPQDPGDVAIIELKNNGRDRWTNGVIYAN